MRVKQAILLSLRTAPLAIGSSVRSDSWTVGQTVTTSSGPVDGHAASVFADVSEYLSIPFAQPPTGKLRFQPPVKYNGTRAINGTNFGFSCFTPLSGASKGPRDAASKIVPAYNSATNPSTNQSEDCLTLNIWTKPQTGEAKKAVMVWIHGGEFFSGSSSVPWYDGQTFADEQDVIVVTLNYRLSIFGFPGNPVGQPNLGLLDQRLAIEWVRDNIKAFGGDPARITLFGESSGGASADFYSYAWTDDPIITGFIFMSGSVVGKETGALANDTANEFWFNATQKAGCGDSSANLDEVFECMTKVSAKEIAQSLPNHSLLDSRPRPFNPVIDESLVYSDYTTRKPISAPVMVGNTDFEAGLGLVFRPNASKEVIEGLNSGFTCSAAGRAAASVMAGNPTWRYRWFGDFPNTQLTANPPSKAYHTSELGSLFNTTLSDVVPDTPEEKAIGSYFRGLWAAFAKDPVSGATNYGDGVPMYSSNQSTLIRLGYQNSTGPNLGIGSQYDVVCPNIPVVVSPTNGSSPTSTSTPAPSGNAPGASIATRLAPTTGLLLVVFTVFSLV